MELSPNTIDRLRKLAIYRQKVNERAAIAPSTHFRHAWHSFCAGNYRKAMISFKLAVCTAHNTIVNPSAGVRRKR